MRELGKKDEVAVVGLTTLDVRGRPRSMPLVHGATVVICGYDRGFGEVLFVCESLEDMQERYDAYSQGWALRIKWYRGEISEVLVVEVGPDEEASAGIIARACPNVPVEVKQALAAYAKGNPGAATVLSERAKDFVSAKQVEDLVGWPLSEHSTERAGEIWDRLQVSVPSDETTSPWLCECDSFDCGLSVDLPVDEGLKLSCRGQIIIIDGCQEGSPSGYELVDQWGGYGVYEEKST